ncbi:MAG: hypothetical protein U5R48_11655 [Gammaproteobacteria bacterium]|nr:hypothetical protein [Gammaproteobacteria bacterium]
MSYRVSDFRPAGPRPVLPGKPLADVAGAARDRPGLAAGLRVRCRGGGDRHRR